MFAVVHGRSREGNKGVNQNHGSHVTSARHHSTYFSDKTMNISCILPEHAPTPRSLLHKTCSQWTSQNRLITHQPRRLRVPSQSRDCRHLQGVHHCEPTRILFQVLCSFNGNLSTQLKRGGRRKKKRSEKLERHPGVLSRLSASSPTILT